MKSLNYAIVFIIICMLSACSSNPAVIPKNYYYTLSPQLSLPSVKAKKLVNLHIVEIPHYLKQEPLVMRLSDQQMSVANYHFWAEKPDAAIKKAIQQYLLVQQQLLVSNNCKACEYIKINITEFCSDVNGKVVLSGFYQIANENYTFGFSKQLEQGGYAGAVNIMQQLLEHLSQQIAEGL